MTHKAQLLAYRSAAKKLLRAGHVNLADIVATFTAEEKQAYDAAREDFSALRELLELP